MNGPFLGTLAGALIGGLSAYFVQRWRYGVDRWTVITDELCKEIIGLGDQSSQFWLKERNANNKDEMALLELLIKGRQARIDALKAPFEDWCPRGAHVRFTKKYGEFVDAVTGGQFTATKRSSNPQLAFEVQQATAEVVAEIRSSLRQGLGVRAMIDRFTRKD